MACALPHDGEALLVSAEVDAATLEQVDVLDGPSRRFSNHILVAQERAATDGVFTMASVVGFLKWCGKALQRGHPRSSQTG